jgi:hypothetical protein
MTLRSELAQSINRLCESAESLWKDYQIQGPGRIDAVSFDHVQAAAEELETALGRTTLPERLADIVNEPAAWIRELQDCVSLLCELSRRCACTPQGLSFITGEAGLLPRRDQHEAFEQTLIRLRREAQLVDSAI